MSIWFEFSPALDQVATEQDSNRWTTIDIPPVSVDALEAAKAICREDGKSWALLTLDERDHYEHLACEAVVAMGGSRV